MLKIQTLLIIRILIIQILIIQTQNEIQIQNKILILILILPVGNRNVEPIPRTTLLHTNTQLTKSISLISSDNQTTNPNNISNPNPTQSQTIPYLITCRGRSMHFLLDDIGETVVGLESVLIAQFVSCVLLFVCLFVCSF